MSQEIWRAAWCGTEHVISVDRNRSEIYISAFSDRMNAGGWIDSTFLRENPKASDKEIISYVRRQYWPDLPGTDPVCEARHGKALQDLLERYFK